ncbi:MAG: hypothetical protein ACR2RV_04715 [Verrucomicrobiales bacterium]
MMSRRTLIIACLISAAAAAVAGHLVRRSQAAGSPAAPAGDLDGERHALTSQLGGSGQGSPTWNHLAANLSRASDPADFARLLGLPANRDRHRQNLIMLRWTEVDPRAAIEFIRENEDYRSHARMAFESWGRRDPEAAFAGCIGFGRGENICAKAVLDGAFESDPDRAFAMFFATKEKLRKGWGTSMEVSISGGVFDHPELTLNMIERHGRDTSWARSSRHFLLESLVEDDPQAALAWARAHMDGLGSDRGSFAQMLAGADPALAMEFFSALPPDDITPSIVAAAASGLAKTDPQAGLEFVEANTTGRAQIDARNGMLASLAKRDPGAAAPTIRELVGSGERTGRAVQALMESWVKQSPLEARAWTQTLEVAKVQDAAARALSHEWYQLDRDGLSEFVDGGSTEDVSVAFLSGIANGPLSWGSDSDNRRLEWLRSLPERHSSRVLDEVIGATAKSDPELAVGSVATFGSARLRTAAVGALLASDLGSSSGGLARLVAEGADPSLGEVFLEALQDPGLDAQRAARVAAQIRADSAGD